MLFIIFYNIHPVLYISLIKFHWHGNIGPPSRRNWSTLTNCCPSLWKTTIWIYYEIWPRYI